jgi:hypothetical protein
MNKPTILTLALTLALCTACAGLSGPAPDPGEPLAALIAKKGRPTNTYQAGDITILEYATGPYGQETYMARIGADGLLQSWQQVLNDQTFATIKPGLTTRTEVLHTLGRPAETGYLQLSKLEVWSYRYKQSGVWDSMMHVHFDQAGIVRMMQNGPDLLREEPFFFR